jgi:formamidopyrimidine-DNA glycosylase
VPELPEVETVRVDLAATLTGRRIDSVAATGERTLRRHRRPAEFVERVAGRRLVEVDRRGKYLILRLDPVDAVVVHLGMSGQLRLAEPGSPTVSHTHVVWALEGGLELRFIDPRTFGEVFASLGPGRDRLPVEIDHLGPDALGADRATLAGVVGRRRTRLKPLLLDQRAIAGIGNIYADEILWSARLHPDRPAGGLSPRELTRLADACAEVLAAAVAARGSSLPDLQYRDVWGGLGGYQAFHRAYGREAQPCARCGRPIRRRADAGRSTYFCASCQPRRTSRPRSASGGGGAH